MNETPNPGYFRIWQQNIAKSSIAQHELLVMAGLGNWDVMALQEPYIDHLGLMHANSHWTVIYPSNKNQQNQNHTRSVILVGLHINQLQIHQVNILL